jgi:hypothetical protein
MDEFQFPFGIAEGGKQLARSLKAGLLPRRLASRMKSSADS